ncbi:diguanylate cyclase domain-containing protein [Cohnella zeiphila]|uniref:Diguanylate cyclase n=1 Tax=Cohnella zeiphila TaxID=2761120 RepID=A0A7X0SSJ6_9BACL|nr:diguanylate cyclase [Cohnella zeiphila]MBB6733098.1 diguanylate cyclase [Cohnella zeiphila]
MRRNQGGLLSDGAYLLLFIFSFICIVYMAGDPDRYMYNIIFLNVAFLIAIITYFTNVTTGLILNILFIFGYGTYVLYTTVVQGALVSAQNYVWLLFTPMLTLITWMMTQANHKLQNENARLQKLNSSLATMDEHTDLKNNLSFQKDAQTFIALSTRYQIPLTLVVIGVKYWEEIQRLITREQMTETVYAITQFSLSSIRNNDSLYMLNSDNPTWGLLLFTDREGANVVIERLRQRNREMNESMDRSKRNVELNLRIGAYQFDPETSQSPLEFLALARKQLEYDV